MLMFVIYRFLTWRSHYKTFVGYNQYVLLIVNLLAADMMQGISFMFSFHWIYRDGIFAPSRTCFSQGFLLNLGDLASGFFVFGIAMHTFYGAVYGGHVKHTTFGVMVLSSWLLAIFLSALGPIMHRDDYFVRAGAWCWASAKYETERLALHYIWIFLVQFGTIVLYALIFLHLKRSMVHILPKGQSATHAKVDRAAKLMVLFPIAYIILTLPLSAGRMWTRATGRQSLPDSYALAAGSMIGSCGIVDCLLYTFTRQSLLKQTNKDPSDDSANAERRQSNLRMSYFGAKVVGITQTRTVTVTGDRLSQISDICSIDDSDSISGHSLSRSTTAVRAGDKTTYPSMDIARVSPMASQERIVTPGINGLDPRRGGRKVEITATAVDSDSVSEQEYASAADASRIHRVGSPHSMRAALGLLRGLSTKSGGGSGI